MNSIHRPIFAALITVTLFLQIPKQLFASAETEGVDIKKFTVLQRNGQDRDILVPIPHSIEYKLNYFRLYVHNYMMAHNTALRMWMQTWEYDKTAEGIYNYSLYSGHLFTIFRDLDDIGPEETGSGERWLAEQFSAENRATIAANKDAKLLLKLEKKKPAPKRNPPDPKAASGSK